MAVAKLSLDPNYDIEVIKKPRTHFTNNCLRRVIPAMNIQDKIGSISSNKLNILSALRIKTQHSIAEDDFFFKKVKTVNVLPKMLSFDAGVAKLKNKIKKGASKRPSSSKAIQSAMENTNKAPEKDLGGFKPIEEEKNPAEGSDNSDSSASASADNDSDEDSGDSSIDMGGGEETEEQLMA